MTTTSITPPPVKKENWPSCRISPLEQIGDYQVLTPASTKGGVNYPKVRMFTHLETTDRSWFTSTRQTIGRDGIAFSRPVETPVIRILTLNDVKNELNANRTWQNRLRNNSSSYDSWFVAMGRAHRGIVQCNKAIRDLLQATFSQIRL
jgi:hypothetical protein